MAAEPTLASTSQIAKSLHSGNRKSSRALALLFLAGTVAIAIPATYLAFKDAPIVANLGQINPGQMSFGQLTQSLQKLIPANLLPKSDKSSTQDAATQTATAQGATGAALAPGQAASPTQSQMHIVDQTVTSLNKALEANPGNANVHNRLGIIFAEMGEMGKAEAQFKQAIMLSKSQLGAAYQSLNNLKMQGKTDEAANVMLNVSGLQLELSSAHSNLARVYEKLGENQKVIKELEAMNQEVSISAGMTAVTPKGQERLSPEVVAGLARSEACMQAGRMEEAAHELKALISVAPNLAQAHELLGRTGMATNNFYLAQRELETAAKLDGKSATTFANLGLVYLQRHKTKEAVQAMKTALVLNPNDAVTAFNLGNIYANQNQIKAAGAYYQKAISIDPRMAAAHNNLASMYSLSGQYEVAIQEFEKALEFAPGMASAHYGMGLCMYNLKDFSGASTKFKETLALNPNIFDARDKLQICMRQSGIR